MDRAPTQQIPTPNQVVKVNRSTEQEIEKIASELANGYIDYLYIDTRIERERTRDTIEEHLTHLEEVSSVLDKHSQNSEKMLNDLENLFKADSFSLKLYDQIDMLEQSSSEINSLLDQLEIVMNEMECHKPGTPGKIQQIMGFLPKISFNSMPRLRLLETFGNMVDQSGSRNSTEQGRDDHQITRSLEDLLQKVSAIEASILAVSSDLNTKLH